MTTEKNNADNEVEESTEEVVEEVVVEAEEAPAVEAAEEVVADVAVEEPEVARTPRSTTSAPQNRAELNSHTTDRHAHNAQNR